MTVSTEIRGNAVVVTLRWTDKRNALSAEDADVLAAAISVAGEESEEIHQAIYRRVQGIIQGGLLGSEDFRALTEKLLGKS